MKWKLVELGGIVLTLAALIALFLVPWYIAVTISIVRGAFGIFCVYLSKSYSTRLQNGEVVLVSFGMIDHIVDKKSLYLQSPQSL